MRHEMLFCRQRIAASQMEWQINDPIWIHYIKTTSIRCNLQMTNENSTDITDDISHSV